MSISAAPQIQKLIPSILQLGFDFAHKNDTLKQYIQQVLSVNHERKESNIHANIITLCPLSVSSAVIGPRARALISVSLVFMDATVTYGMA